MKKETVSNDSLKEKIEEILTPYPDPLSRNDFRIVCHIGTRTSLYLLPAVSYTHLTLPTNSRV